MIRYTKVLGIRPSVLEVGVNDKPPPFLWDRFIILVTYHYNFFASSYSTGTSFQNIYDLLISHLARSHYCCQV